MNSNHRLAALAAALLSFAAAPAMAAALFADDFNRPNSSTVGNGWAETENGSSDVAIVNGALQLRDELPGNPDAAASRLSGISTVGYTNVQLSYSWAPLSDSEVDDLLHVEWRVGPNGTWQSVAVHGLGGSGFSSQSFSLGAGAAGIADFELRFWTDVSDSTEGALIDSVSLTADPANAVPAPGTVGLLGLGLLGLAWVRRRPM